MTGTTAKGKSAAPGRKPARTEQAARSRQAMQRASSVRKPKLGGTGDGAATSGRKGQKGVVTYLTPEAKEQLAGLAASENKSVQALGLEAMNLLFTAYRLKPIA